MCRGGREMCRGGRERGEWCVEGRKNSQLVLEVCVCRGGESTKSSPPPLPNATKEQPMD